MIFSNCGAQITWPTSVWCSLWKDPSGAEKSDWLDYHGYWVDGLSSIVELLDMRGWYDLMSLRVNATQVIHSEPSLGPGQRSSLSLSWKLLWIILFGNEDKKSLFHRAVNGSVGIKLETKTTPDPISSWAVLKTTLTCKTSISNRLK